MKIEILLAAALAVSATTSLSYAGGTSYQEQIARSTSRKAETASTDGSTQTASPLLEFIRGGRGNSAEAKRAAAAAKAQGATNVDRMTTSSVRKQEKASTKTRRSASAKRQTKTKTITTKSVASTGGTGDAYHTIIAQYAHAYGVPVSLANAVVRIESNFRVNARGRAGEVGLMQIKPATARMMGYSGSVKGLYHPETNIKYGMKYLAKAHQLGGGSTCGTILKYNAGHGAKRMNKTSAAYCSKVRRILGQ